MSAERELDLEASLKAAGMVDISLDSPDMARPVRPLLESRETSLNVCVGNCLLPIHQNVAAERPTSPDSPID